MTVDGYIDFRSCATCSHVIRLEWRLNWRLFCIRLIPLGYLDMSIQSLHFYMSRLIDKTKKMTAKLRSLCAHWVAKDPSFLRADSEDSEQTGRMPRLIWVFAGRTCHFVGLGTRQLKYIYWQSHYKNGKNDVDVVTLSIWIKLNLFIQS